MVIDRRYSWRERKIMLEWTGRVKYRVVMNIEGIKVERNVRVGVGVHGKWMLPGMIERVITKSSIPVWIIGYHNTIGGVYLGRKLGRPLSRLCRT